MDRRRKRCSKCKRHLARSSFHADKRKLDGLRYWCKRCARDNSYKRAYGISGDEYRKLLEDQGGRCRICNSDKGKGHGGRMAVDHDHDTGEVRGLLCGSCNLGLGHFGDDPIRMAAAIEYLRSR